MCDFEFVRYAAIIILIILMGCDQVSQRIWNCGSDPLEITKVLDNGKRVRDVIPARSYIGSMNGGVQVMSLERGEDASRRTIWRREQSRAGLSNSADELCGTARQGVVAEQL